MTPLAHQVLKQLLLPAKDRTFSDPVGVLPLMRDVHYFDCRSVTNAAIELVDEMPFDKFKRANDVIGFLPAPRTWIEFRSPNFDSAAFLLQDGDDYARLYVVRKSRSGTAAPQFTSGIGFRKMRVPLRGTTASGIEIDGVAATVPAAEASFESAAWKVIVGCLALINSHRSIGRKQHLPHVGLQRSLAHKFRATGEFTLHPWTEILLEVNPDAQAAAAGESHLRGAVAFHFVRKYMRIRNGEVEIVSDHWKGDPALGIKQKTYRVKKPKGSEVSE